MDEIGSPLSYEAERCFREEDQRDDALSHEC
jgi:hypothetical protein